jgi:hypothetical protein
MCFWIEGNSPEVRVAKDHVRSSEGFLQRGDIIEIGLNQFDALLSPGLTRRFARVASEASDVPATFFEEDIGNG